MGLMRLFVHDAERLAGLDPTRVHMIGFDELPWFGQVFVTEDQLAIERAQTDSGSVCVPWEVAGRGEMLLATATLMEREEPYFLDVELARGMVNRLRNHLEAWRQLGLEVTGEVEAEVLAATREFTRAVTHQDEQAEAAAAAQRAIERSMDAADGLAALYAGQALGLRVRQTGQLNTLLGVDLGTGLPDEAVGKEIVETFNLVSIPLAWRIVEASEGQRHWQDADAQVRWAQQHHLKIVAGPLLEFDERQVPDWTYLWEGDYDTLAAFMLEHVESVVKRYRGKVHLWHVAARMNRSRVLSLGDEDRLQIVATAVRAVKELDPRAPVVVSFDQPWAEYMATEQVELAPIHFADALVRADLGLAGIGLELNVGNQPRATAPRSPLAFSRLVDQWGLFELPLFLMLTVDARISPQNDKALAKTDPPTSVRAEWIERHLPALLAKNCVQVVLWNELSDVNAEFPSAGLFDESGRPKPALNALKQLRQKYLS